MNANTVRATEKKTIIQESGSRIVLFLSEKSGSRSASAAAKGPAAASALARTPGADVLRLRERPEDAVPAKADNEAKPTAATTAATTAARAAATTAATTK